MKWCLVLLIGFFSVAAFSQNDDLNWAHSPGEHGNACSVEPIVISCVRGGQAVSPGCAISCKENQTAKCDQGEVFAHTCTGLPASCRCN